MAGKGMEEEFLTCSICFDVYKEPKTLTCLHRFCGKCLHNYITSQKKSALQKVNGFPCPVCREIIKVPDPGKDPSEWSDSFKTDFHLTNLIQFVEKKRTTTVRAERSSHTNACNVHKDKELDLYCVDCQSIICHLCAGINHRGCSDVVTLKEVASKQRVAIEKALKCVEKEINEINLIREKTLNAFEKQKSNAEVHIMKCAEEWRSAIDKEEKRLIKILEDQCEKVYNKITPQLLDFDLKISTFSEKSNIFRKNHNEVSDFEVMSMFPKGVDFQALGFHSYEKVVANIKQLEINFKQTYKPEVKLGAVVFSTHQESPTSPSNPQKIEILSESGTNMVYTLENHESVLYSSDISQKDNPFHGLERPASNSPRKSFREKISKFISSPFSQNEDRPSSEAKKPSPSQKPTGAKIKGNVSWIPEDKSQENSNRFMNKPSTSSEDENAVEKIRTISTRFRDDSVDPKLRDVIVLGHGGSTVVVTDWANECVKAFYVRRDKNSRLEVGGKPWSIAQLSDVSTAVSLPLSKQICILKVSPPLMMQKSFVSAKNYSGLASLNSRMLVASGGNDPPCVDIINLYGEYYVFEIDQILRSFSLSATGAPLFLYPSYVCVTPSLFILVSDKKQEAVICLSHTGEVKFKFHPKPPRNLQEPCGICTTPSGHVMVAESRGLLQLTPMGQMDRPLIRRIDGYVNNPKGVAIDADGLIYLTTDEQEVAVFKLNL